MSVPKIWSIWTPICFSPLLFSQARRKAPMVTPRTLPMPPSTTIKQHQHRLAEVEPDGEQAVVIADAFATPPTPPKKAPTAYARSFTLTSGNTHHGGGQLVLADGQPRRPSRPPDPQGDEDADPDQETEDEDLPHCRPRSW